MSKLGIVGTSRKENERRVAIHPDHLDRIPLELRKNILFEQGYGLPFGISDNVLESQCGGLASRAELFRHNDIVLVVPKPTLSDLEDTCEHGTIWGWHHCVQQRAATQAAIDRKLTLIAFEEMFVWGPDGTRGRHTFYKNNELAGYCAVLHALRLRGTDGHYGKQRKVVILSFGAVSRGAIYALKARGFRDITICVQREDHLVREEVLGCHYLRMRDFKDDDQCMISVEHDGTERPLLELLSDADILVNGTFQDPAQPLMFVNAEDTSKLKAGCLIIDVSCDDGMGFPFAKPTTFDEPLIKVGSLDYYAVDHTPSYLWESASWEISTALLRFLPQIMAGAKTWKASATIQRSVEIQEGVVQNPKILSHQQRASEYPHGPV